MTLTYSALRDGRDVAPSVRKDLRSTSRHASAVAPKPRGRGPIHPDIDEAMIERLVRHFYGRIRKDEILGPIFADAIGEAWEPHLQTMMAFWSSVTLMSGRFHGRPMEKHQALAPVVRPAHFAHWLTLFRDSAREICPAEIATIFIDRAERIGESLQHGMFGTGNTANLSAG